MRPIDSDELLTAFPADDEPTVTKSFVRMTIKRMPTVDATPVKRGRWIKNEFGSRCACCGLYAYRYENGRPWESDYCPYCGADLRGERHEVI